MEPQLLTQLEPELLRGVPLHECLSGWGKHWRPPKAGMFNVDPGNYELSRPMEYFDDFLSHDWRTSRWLKLMSMLIVYNSRAALVAMCIASIAMGIVRVYVESPEDPMLNLKLTLIAVVICHGVHLVFLCFWQRFCSLLLTPTFVFLDKLCIAQSPELAERKAKGILGLAAFLNHSRRLVVLWSPRYFQRLWCSYEIATYLTASNEHKPLIVMPAHAGAILFVEYLGWAGISAAFWLSLFAIGTNIWGVMDLLPFAFGRVVIGGSLVAGVAVCVAVPLLAWEISLARHVQHVQQQLLTFNMQETLCYCCSNQHRHPDSGEEIPCDRKLVYQKLREWHGQPDDVGEEYLSRFNTLVQRRLSSSILRSMSNFIPRRYTFYMIAATNLPWFSECVRRMITEPRIVKEDNDDVVVILRHFLEWGTISLVALSGSWLSRFLALHVGVRLARALGSSICAAMLVFPLCIPLVAAFLGSFYYLLIADSGLLCAIPFCLLLILLVCYSLSRPSLRPVESETTVKMANKQATSDEESSKNSHRFAIRSDANSPTSTASFSF